VTSAIETWDIQGNILNGYNADFACYLFLAAETTEAARTLLQQVHRQVTTANPWSLGQRPLATLNVAVTASGLARLGLPDRMLARFPEAFQQPVADRVRCHPELGDVGANSPEHWQEGLGTGEAHLLISVHAVSEAERERAVEKLGQLIESDAALRVVHCQEAHALEGRREHFGFADGFAQPAIAGVPRLSRRRRRQVRGGGVPLPGTDWRPVQLGEFVLGYEDEDGQMVSEPDPDLVRNGTFMVYRKLRQDVAGFRALLEEAEQRYDLSPELLAAKIVGRWRDGTPLVTEPNHDPGNDPERTADREVSNDFRYLPHDREGYACPVGAHVRRANPRDALGQGRLSARHRIIRRGMPYGTELPLHAVDDDADRGLIFIAYNADLARQFETIQAEWCNDGDAFGLGGDRDFLIGAGRSGGNEARSKLTVPVRGGPPILVETLPGLVRTSGMEYLFVPGIEALHHLAEGRFAGLQQRAVGAHLSELGGHG
jgi:Dyp-type peroxidase family